MDNVFPGSALHEETSYSQTVSYSNLFNKVTAPENQSRFKTLEIAAANYISQNFDVGTLKNYECEWWRNKDQDNNNQVTFQFHAKPDDVLYSSPDTVNIKNAHEFKHGSLVYDHFVNGKVNIFSLKRAAEFYCADLAQASKEIPALNFLIKPMAYLGKVAHAAFSRQEERICDDFAIRAYPEADLTEIKEEFEDLDRKPDNIEIVLSDGQRFLAPREHFERKPSNLFEMAMSNLQSITKRLTADHPSGAQRNAAFSKAQQRSKM